MRRRPRGIVTFLFTDIVSSTRLWEQFPASMPAAFAQHERLLRQACAAHGGFVYKMVGDALQVAFDNAAPALLAAVAAQRALIQAAWGETGPLAVRMALHTGQTEERGDDYLGPPLNRLARMLDAGFGGQILVSQDTAGLLANALPPEISLLNLGQHQLKHLARPEQIFQASAPGLPQHFPALKTLTLRPTNLPSPLTPFIGREQELAMITALLRRPAVRLLALTGPAGIGKSRLALQAATNLLAEFPDGACWLSLESLEDQAQVLPALGRIWGIGAAPEQSLPAAMAAYLDQRSLLLLLDNAGDGFDAKSLLAMLLPIAPQIKIIVTSRAMLNLAGQQQLALASLGILGSCIITWGVIRQPLQP
ncbi:MAG TPA: AAA family ATPase [Herpetosiphonaceae bacterium]|nr:AAA family ATPase [Herpetosiphonaceae bacterium]